MTTLTELPAGPRSRATEPSCLISHAVPMFRRSPPATTTGRCAVAVGGVGSTTPSSARRGVACTPFRRGTARARPTGGVQRCARPSPVEPGSWYADPRLALTNIGQHDRTHADEGARFHRHALPD